MPGCWSSFLELLPWTNKDRSYKQFNLASEALKQYRSTENQEDLETALSHFQLALVSRRKTRDDRAHYGLDAILASYADARWLAYEKKPAPENLEKIIEIDEQVCSIWEQQDEATRPASYPGKLLDLANAYFAKYSQQGSEDSFIKAVEKYEKLLKGSIKVSGDVRGKGDMKYGVALTKWCDNQEGRMTPETKKRLDAGILYLERTLNSNSDDKSIRHTCLLHLAIAYYKRYQDDKTLIRDLERAIKHNQDLLKSIPEEHPDYVYCKFDLVQQLFDQWEYEKKHPDTQVSLEVEDKAKKLHKKLQRVKTVANDLLEQLDQAQYGGIVNDVNRILQLLEQRSRSNSPRSFNEGPSAGRSSPNGSHT